MICTHSGVTGSFPITDAYGSLFQGTKVCTFPAAFTEPPVGIVGTISATTGAGWGAIANTTAVIATLRAYDVTSRPSGTEIRLKLMALGRWK